MVGCAGLTVTVVIMIVDLAISTCADAIILHAAQINITLELSAYTAAEGDGFVELCAVIVGGGIEDGQTIITQLATSPGTASTGKRKWSQSHIKFGLNHCDSQPFII